LHQTNPIEDLIKEQGMSKTLDSIILYLQSLESREPYVEILLKDLSSARNRYSSRYKTQLHPSHEVRVSDASTYDMICVRCKATDNVPGGWGLLVEPCLETNRCQLCNMIGCNGGCNYD